MCTFNGSRYLREQLDSIVAQTYPITEMLIFDDGSTDESMQILEEYEKQFPFISLHRNELNLGFNANFEKALRSATAEVIAIADQDDYWHPEKIERMISRWDRSKPIIHCDSQRFKNKRVENTAAKKLNCRFEGIDSRKLFLFNSVSGHATIIQKSFLPFIFPFDESLYYDWWIAFVASFNGGVAYLNETLVYQRVHSSNVSIDSKTATRESFQRYRDIVTRHVRKFLTAPNLPPHVNEFGNKLYQCLTSLSVKETKFTLFLFMFKNRHLVFYYKKRRMPLFSHFKHAIRWAFIDQNRNSINF
jgi:glycosyltransferase involved in cell wall biosynthesis